MKPIRIDQIDTLRGRRIEPGDTFQFGCHPGVPCFNRCCRNLNLFLYPYDVLRLKHRLNLSSGDFLDRHVDVVLRSGDFFPEVLLRMNEDAEKTCPFLTENGCAVYSDRPDTCRHFPVEYGRIHDENTGEARLVHFFRTPDFCQGEKEPTVWTLESWLDDQDTRRHVRMTLAWAEIRQMLQNDPWGAEGPAGRRAKMAFMAAYNMDAFREFVFGSSFLKRYKIKPDLKRKLRAREAELLKLGFEWIRFFLWGLTPSMFKPVKPPAGPATHPWQTGL